MRRPCSSRCARCTSASGHAREDRRRAGPQLLVAGDIGHQRRPRDVEGTAARQLLQVEGRRRSGGVAEADHEAAGSETVEGLLEGRRADAVVDHRQHGAIAEFAHPRHHVVLRCQQAVRVAVGERPLALAFAADDTDDLGADGRGPLAEEQADAAGRGVEQCLLPGLQGEGPAQKVLHGGALEQHRGGGVEIDAVGNLHQTPGGQQQRLAVGADSGGAVGDAAAGGQGHAVAHGLDHTGALEADARRQRQGIEPAAVVGVNEIQTDGAVRHAHHAGAGGGQIPLHELHDLRTAGLCHLDAFHHAGRLLCATRLPPARGARTRPVPRRPWP